mmetsp:Transcript_19932/g.41737  ORF Transcript_19932/g.41737 Transcript_19932/m.41737 type:complete len:131 (-) Transcript_19932:15-407(-)
MNDVVHLDNVREFCPICTITCKPLTTSRNKSVPIPALEAAPPSFCHSSTLKHFVSKFALFLEPSQVLFELCTSNNVVHQHNTLQHIQRLLDIPHLNEYHHQCFFGAGERKKYSTGCRGMMSSFSYSAMDS